MKATILFTSVAGHTYDLAEAIAEGFRSEGFEANLWRVQETFSDDDVKFWGAQRERFAHVQEAKWGDLTPLKDIDALFVGGPVYFGNISSSVYDWLQHTAAPPWLNGDLHTVPCAAFCSCASQNGGAEEAIRNMHTTLMHFGMPIIPFPSHHTIHEMRQHDMPIGGTVYGCSAANGMNATVRPVHEMEKTLARMHAAYVAKIAKALKTLREA